jgi:cellulose synthase/poly-beta-1,6-N-acetylglucosamine synthase-like glycosyltransferase
MKKKINQPFFSVVIPLQQLSYVLLFENLPALNNQTYKKFEVIVLPNEHSQYDISLLKKYKWVRIIPTGNSTKPAEKRNIGAKQAKGNIVMFLDDDAYPRDDCIEQASNLFTGKIVAVCGPGILPPHASLWEKVFDEVLKSWVGSGGYTYRFTRRKKRYVDDYPSMNFSIDKNIFLQLGGFKGNYWPGEDSKLCEDVVYKERKKILYHPRVVVFHHRRKDLASYVRQHANYGFHRGAFFAHGDKNSRRISYLIPTFFIFYLLSLITVFK